MSTHPVSMPEHFARDLDRFNKEFVRLGAVVMFPDGEKGIDPEKAPGVLLDAYCRLQQYGYANGYFT